MTQTTAIVLDLDCALVPIGHYPDGGCGKVFDRGPLIQYALGMKHVLVINGPNLNMLGTREPDIYGSTTLNELETLVSGWGDELGIEVTCFQSNHEGELIDRLHAARSVHDGVVINAGALTHYSYALHDAILAAGLPTVEVHISNIKAREVWRHTSVIEPACTYSIHGRGLDGYRYALASLRNRAVTPPMTVSYGPTPDQVGDLRVPAGAGPHPVAVLIHGGFWRDHWTRDTLDSIAIDLTSRGWATWNLEYRRVGTGGGWPQTLEDVAAGIEHLATLGKEHSLHPEKVVVIGHSAGGHLALWAAAHPQMSISVQLRAAVGLAPVADLESGYEDDLGDGAVLAFLGQGPVADEARYASTSPRSLLPMGVPQIIIHGTLDDAVPVEMSRGYAKAAIAAGDSMAFHEIDGADHMDVIDPHHAAWSKVISELDGLS